MTQRFYFLHYSNETEHLAVTEVSKHKFDNTRGFEVLSKLNNIPRAVKTKMAELSKLEPESLFHLFLSR